MDHLTLDLLTEASSPGGPSCLSSVTPLRPAAGAQASIAPAKFTQQARGGDAAAYAYEKRYLDGTLRNTVLVDSKQSQLNRVEAALQQGIDDGVEILGRMPRIEVTYPDGSVYSDLTLPHRAFDGHIRAGSIAGVPTTQTAQYRALRDANPADASALLNASPVTLVLGGWDSSRKSSQGRWRSALVGEIVGFLAGDGLSDDRPSPARHSGARVDPVGMQVRLDGRTMRSLVDDQRADMSPKTVEDLNKAASTAEKAKTQISASALGLGGIPPGLQSLAGVACEQIVRSHVLSFAALRQMRFGAGPEGDAACRALLAALALDGLARSDAELYLRANCDLVEGGETVMDIDRRGGESTRLEPLAVREADELLSAALQRAESLAGVSWNGVTLRVVGNPAVVANVLDTEQAQ